MKFLKMYAQMDNHQMVEGSDKSFIDTKNIYEYTLEYTVKNRKNIWVGSAIVCRSKGNICYLTPPLDYVQFHKDINYIESCIERDEKCLTDEKKKEFVENKAKLEFYLKKMQDFIPYLLRTIKSANDGVILEVVVEDNIWVIKEVGE